MRTRTAPAVGVALLLQACIAGTVLADETHTIDYKEWTQPLIRHNDLLFPTLNRTFTVNPTPFAWPVVSEEDYLHVWGHGELAGGLGTATFFNPEFLFDDRYLSGNQSSSGGFGGNCGTIGSFGAAPGAIVDVTFDATCPFDRKTVPAGLHGIKVRNRDPNPPSVFAWEAEIVHTATYTYTQPGSTTQISRGEAVLNETHDRTLRADEQGVHSRARDNETSASTLRQERQATLARARDNATADALAAAHARHDVHDAWQTSWSNETMTLLDRLMTDDALHWAVSNRTESNTMDALTRDAFLQRYLLAAWIVQNATAWNASVSAWGTGRVVDLIGAPHSTIFGDLETIKNQTQAIRNEHNQTHPSQRMWRQDLGGGSVVSAYGSEAGSIATMAPFTVVDPLANGLRTGTSLVHVDGSFSLHMLDQEQEQYTVNVEWDDPSNGTSSTATFDQGDACGTYQLVPPGSGTSAHVPAVVAFDVHTDCRLPSFVHNGTHTLHVWEESTNPYTDVQGELHFSLLSYEDTLEPGSVVGNATGGNGTLERGSGASNFTFTGNQSGQRTLLTFSYGGGVFRMDQVVESNGTSDPSMQASDIAWILWLAYVALIFVLPKGALRLLAAAVGLSIVFMPLPGAEAFALTLGQAAVLVYVGFTFMESWGLRA